MRMFGVLHLCEFLAVITLMTTLPGVNGLDMNSHTIRRFEIFAGATIFNDPIKALTTFVLGT